MSASIDKKLFGEGFFGHVKRNVKVGLMAERFAVPPFSILDTTAGQWKSRKAAWLALGLKGEEGRREDTNNDATGIAYRKTLDGFGKELRNKYKLKEMGLANDHIDETPTGTSVFDPVLCELVYRWFTKPGWSVLDPFAGGSTRGIVAATLGRRYHGVEVRSLQVAANTEQAKLLQIEPSVCKWTVGDSKHISSLVPDEADLLFSCPPYYDREVYSSDTRDGSTHPTYDEFIIWLEDIFNQSLSRLKRDRFAAIVVGEIRNQKTGEYRNFVADTIKIFMDAGLAYWNECVIVTSRGSLSLRTNRPFCQTRKIGKAHQNLLVFYKGDLANMRETFEVPVGEIE